MLTSRKTNPAFFQNKPCTGGWVSVEKLCHELLYFTEVGDVIAEKVEPVVDSVVKSVTKALGVAVEQAPRQGGPLLNALKDAVGSEGKTAWIFNVDVLVLVLIQVGFTAQHHPKNYTVYSGLSGIWVVNCWWWKANSQISFFISGCFLFN